MLNAYMDEQEYQESVPEDTEGAFYDTPYSLGKSGTITPITFLIGLIGLLVIMRVIGDSDKTDIQPAHIQIGGFNLLAVTTAAVVGIVSLKLIFNRWYIPGVTDLINAV